MKLRLTYPQAIIFLSPLLIGILLLTCSRPGSGIYSVASQIINIVSVVNLFAMLCYQAWLALEFYNISASKNRVFYINALIPVCFFGFNILYLIYHYFTSPAAPPREYDSGPITQANITLEGVIIFIVLVHAGITFLFINNYFVSNQIKKIEDPEMQESLRTKYLAPMKIIVKAFLWIWLLAILCPLGVDVIRYWLHWR